MNRDEYYQKTIKNLKRLEKEESGNGDISDSVERLIDKAAYEGSFSTGNLFSKDPVFVHLVFCRNTLEEAGFDVDVEQRGNMIVSINVSWDQVEPED